MLWRPALFISRRCEHHHKASTMRLALVLEEIFILSSLLWYCASAGDVVVAYYLSESCNITPNRVDFEPGYCIDECKDFLNGDWKSKKYFCPNTDYKEKIWDAFGGTPYLLQEAFDSNCSEQRGAAAFTAQGTCQQVIRYMENWGYAVYTVAQVQVDGSVSVQYYTDSDCSTSLHDGVPFTEYITAIDTTIDAAILNSNTCDENGYRWSYYNLSWPYIPDVSSASLSSSASGANANVSDIRESSSNLGSIIGIGGGVFAVGFVALVFVLYRRRRKRYAEDTDRSVYLNPSTPPIDQQPMASGCSNGGSQGQSDLWTDDAITAVRIDHQNVKLKGLLSQGAFGEVHKGKYNNKPVAVKRLKHDKRGITSHLNDFLAEAKMTASMDHPRIVNFIGVAWESKSDLWVVMEYMDGGDLRTLLAGYEAAKHPVGIDREKATIALHVCHALTYLHSLSPPIIHRDLKSRNILLNHALEAKLIDFGISRERLGQTLTEGVGTLLWMAPEVILGEKYDDKADMFSFGVVLSELDTHTLPYDKFRNENLDPYGRRLPVSCIQRKVANGKLSVDFSEESLNSIAELGRACVSVESTLRPTAEKALSALRDALSALSCSERI